MIFVTRGRNGEQDDDYDDDDYGDDDPDILMIISVVTV